MALSRLIEYIESIYYEGGGLIAEYGMQQIIVPQWLTGVQWTNSIVPASGTYAIICYRHSFSPNMLANAFSGSVFQVGRSIYSGIITQLSIDQGLEFFMVVTNSNPLISTMTNNSALAQYFESITEFISVRTKEDMTEIVKSLQNLAGAGERKLQQDAVNLLGRIAEVSS